MNLTRSAQNATPGSDPKREPKRTFKVQIEMQMQTMHVAKWQALKKSEAILQKYYVNIKGILKNISLSVCIRVCVRRRICMHIVFCSKVSIQNVSQKAAEMWPKRVPEVPKPDNWKAQG